MYEFLHTIQQQTVVSTAAVGVRTALPVENSNLVLVHVLLLLYVSARVYTTPTYARKRSLCFFLLAELLA